MDGAATVQHTCVDWYRWRWQRSTRIKPGLEILNGVVSAWCVAVYVYNAYVDTITLPVISYLVASVTFSVEYLMKFLGSKNRWQYVFFSDSLIDLFTIVSVCLCIWQVGGVLYFAEAVDGVSSDALAGIRILRLFQVMRFFKALNSLINMWLRNTINATQLELYKECSALFLVLTCVVFVTGAAFWELEGGLDIDGAPHYLHQAFYWACVTVTTIGYGDFYPGTTLGYSLFPLMVLVILIVVPSRVASMTSALANVNRYMRKVYKSWHLGSHVVVLGNVNHVNAQSFIDEFFHPDRGMQEIELILMRSEPPDSHMSVLLTSHHAFTQLKYLQGSPFIPADLTRAATAQSLAIFVMNNKFAQDVEAEDTRTMLIVLSIAQYLRQNVMRSGNDKALDMSRLCMRQIDGGWRMPPTEGDDQDRAPAPHIFAQFHLPETINRVRRLLEQQDLHPPELGLLQSESTLYPVCTGFVKHALLGASVRCPGLQTMLTNLITTYSVPDMDQMEGSGWVREYLTGAAHEIYEVPLGPHLHGHSYQQAVQMLFKDHNVILLAVRSLSTGDILGRVNVQLAPFADVDAIDCCDMVGYVLANDRDTAYQCSGMNRIQLQIQQGMPAIFHSGALKSAISTSSHASSSGASKRPSATGRVEVATDAQPAAETGTPTGLTPHHQATTTCLQPTVPATAGIHGVSTTPAVHTNGSAAPLGTVELAVARDSSGGSAGASPSFTAQLPPSAHATSAAQDSAAQQLRPAQRAAQPAAAAVQATPAGSSSCESTPMAQRGPTEVSLSGYAQQPSVQGVSPITGSLMQPQQPPVEGYATTVIDLTAAGMQGSAAPPDSGTAMQQPQAGPLQVAVPDDPVHPEHGRTPTATPDASMDGARRSQLVTLAQGAHPSPHPLSPDPQLSTDRSLSSPHPDLAKQSLSFPNQGSLPVPSPASQHSGWGTVARASAMAAALATGRGHRGGGARAGSGLSSLQTRATSLPGSENTLSTITTAANKLISSNKLASEGRGLATRTGSQRLRRLSHAQPLTTVDDLTWPQGPSDLILITGSSCFDHIDDLLAALCGGSMRHVALSLARTDPTAQQASATHNMHSASAPGFNHTAITTSSKDGPSEPQQHLERGASGDGISVDRSVTAGADASATGVKGPAATVTSPFAPLHTDASTRLLCLSRSQIVVMDPEGPTDAQASQVDPSIQLVHLKGDPRLLGSMRKLHLMKGCTVRAVVLPNLAVLAEQSAMGESACEADAETIRVCSNLRQYCEYVGAELEIWAEAVLAISAPFLLPLCLSSGPYNHPTSSTTPTDPETAEDDTFMELPADAWGGCRMSDAQAHDRTLQPPSTHSGMDRTDTQRRPTSRSASQRQHPGPKQSHALSGPMLFSAKSMKMAPGIPAYPSHWRMATHRVTGCMEDLCGSVQFKPSDQELVELRISKALALNPGLSPALAPGAVYTSTGLDKLFAQVVFNPVIIQFLAKILGVWDVGHEPEQPAVTRSVLSDTLVPGVTSTGMEDPAFSSGASTLDMPSRSPVHKDTPPPAFPDAQGPTLDAQEPTLDRDGTACGHLFPLPQLTTVLPNSRWWTVHRNLAYGARHSTATATNSAPMVYTWGDLFLECTSFNMLPVGLYRRDPKSGFPYVYTAPPVDTPLRATDDVYVLAATGQLPAKLLA